MLKKTEQQYLLKLARQALEYYFKENVPLTINPGEVPASLRYESATFVTLTIAKELRGCIGSLEAERQLYKDVIANTYLAAFNDYRFPPLTKGEMQDLRIEISLLSTPKHLDYKDPDDLLKFISKEKPGLVISSGLNSATFLPQVWEELPEAEDFIRQLCQKAGLSHNFWRENPLDVKTYTVESFREN